MAPAMTVACTSSIEVLEGVFDSLDSHEFVFARLTALADGLGCMWSCPLSSLLPLPAFNLKLTRPSFPPSGVTPKAGTDGGVGPENTDISRNNAVPAEKATHDTAAADTPQSSLAAVAPSTPIQNNSVLFS